MDLQLKGKNAVVTAASKGIGKAIAQALAGEGVNVAMALVGNYEAQRTRFDIRELEGRCQGATHVIAAAQVGAFELYAGAAAEIGADVTVEKVGVEVKGLAVYRIAEPLLAFRMMDLDRNSLTEILRDMFVGATRRIVASLTLDECIRHRKDHIAAALMEEIAPILAGEGAPEDTNAAGWGVVLDTIEIQDVRVLSAEVFQRLQAPFREKLALWADRALGRQWKPKEST